MHFRTSDPKNPYRPLQDALHFAQCTLHLLTRYSTQKDTRVPDAEELQIIHEIGKTSHDVTMYAVIIEALLRENGKHDGELPVADKDTALAQMKEWMEKWRSNL